MQALRVGGLGVLFIHEVHTVRGRARHGRRRPPAATDLGLVTPLLTTIDMQPVRCI
jgi:hypothetical protein